MPDVTDIIKRIPGKELFTAIIISAKFCLRGFRFFGVKSLEDSEFNNLSFNISRTQIREGHHFL